MKKITLLLLGLIFASFSYGDEFSLSELQFTTGFKNTNYTRNQSYRDSLNGMTFSLSKQYELPDYFSGATGLDYSLGYNNRNQQKTYKNTLGIVQTFYYIIDQGRYIIRPLFEIGLGLKADSTTDYRGQESKENKTYEYYAKYNVGVETLLLSGIGGQLKYGHEYNRNRIFGPKNRTTDRSYSLSVIYFVR